jgi:hypothetical protein
MSKEVSWSFANLWNDAVYSKQRDLVARDYIYASEIGGALVDRYLKMKAIKPTNPPNMRSLRKFETGNLIEWIVRFVLQRAGLIISEQQKIDWAYDGMLSVHGRLDFLAGGVPDFDKAKADIESLQLPESIVESSMYIVQKLTERYQGVALKKIVLEIKSCSSFVMDMIEKTEKPLKHHKNQCYHYVKGLDMDEGHIVYVCKDDLRMAEFPVWDDAETARAYANDVMAMTKYYRLNERPPLEPLITFEDGKFKKNFQVEYSSYLTLLYGFETPRDYSDSVKSQVARWSRVIARYAKGEKITAKNEEVKAEIIADGYDFNYIVEMAKNAGVSEEEDD